MMWSAVRIAAVPCTTEPRDYMRRVAATSVGRWWIRAHAANRPPCPICDVSFVGGGDVFMLVD